MPQLVRSLSLAEIKKAGIPPFLLSSQFSVSFRAPLFISAYFCLIPIPSCFDSCFDSALNQYA
jgi:hypothetical protein